MKPKAAFVFILATTLLGGPVAFCEPIPAKTKESNTQQAVPTDAHAIVLNVTQQQSPAPALAGSVEKATLATDWVIAISTALLFAATTVLAVFTFLLWRESIRSSRKNSEQMAKSYDEQARASTAMATLAHNSVVNIETLKDVTLKQMRAYVSVSISGGTYQERADGKALHFEVKPLLENSGLTPAYDVKYWAIAKILPLPLPDNEPLPQGTHIDASIVVGPRQSLVLNALVDHFVDDGEVESIKRGNEGRRVFIWGAVTYKDISGAERITEFCHSIYWLPGNHINGHYAFRHNKAT